MLELRCHFCVRRLPVATGSNRPLSAGRVLGRDCVVRSASNSSSCMEPSASSTVLIPLSKSKKTHRGVEARTLAECDGGSSWRTGCALLSSVWAISGSPKAATTRGTNKDRVSMCIIPTLAEPVRTAVASALVRRDPWALSFRCNGRLLESGCLGDRMERHMVIWLAAKVHQRA